MLKQTLPTLRIATGCNAKGRKESLLNFPNEMMQTVFEVSKKKLKGMDLSLTGIRFPV